jgi:hypothetical protein
MGGLPLADLAPDRALAQLLRRVDIFCAKISRRANRAPMSPVQAAREACLGPDGKPDEIGGALETSTRVRFETGDGPDGRAWAPVQRGGQPDASDRLLAAALGVRAAELALAGVSGRMVAWRAGRVVDVPVAEAIVSRPVDPFGPLVATAPQSPTAQRFRDIAAAALANVARLAKPAPRITLH